MKSSPLNLGFASSALLLTLLPAIHALPPQVREDGGQFAPPNYDPYSGAGKAVAYGHYTYGGYGPQPTSTSTSVVVSSDDGASASSSSDPYSK